MSTVSHDVVMLGVITVIAASVDVIIVAVVLTAVQIHVFISFVSRQPSGDRFYHMSLLPSTITYSYTVG